MVGEQAQHQEQGRASGPHQGGHVGAGIDPLGLVLSLAQRAACSGLRSFTQTWISSSTLMLVPLTSNL